MAHPKASGFWRRRGIRQRPGTAGPLRTKTAMEKVAPCSDIRCQRHSEDRNMDHGRAGSRKVRKRGDRDHCSGGKAGGEREIQVDNSVTVTSLTPAIAFKPGLGAVTTTALPCGSGGGGGGTVTGVTAGTDDRWRHWRRRNPERGHAKVPQPGTERPLRRIRP